MTVEGGEHDEGLSYLENMGFDEEELPKLIMVSGGEKVTKDPPCVCGCIYMFVRARGVRVEGLRRALLRCLDCASGLQI